MEYFAEQDRLDGRFLELQEAMDELRDKQVVWRGYLHDVTGLQAKVIVDASGQATRGAWVTFGEDLRTKMYSLRTGDLVEFKGVFRSGGPLWANVDADSVEVVEPIR